MKLVVAFIKPHRLSEVLLALNDIDALYGVSVSDIRGFGRGRAKDAPDRIREHNMDFVPRVRLETICPNHVAGAVITTIEQNAHTGLQGDGKIYAVDVEEVVRISTGERGEVAA
jgi:nitrogen regulatory protein P-II 1